MGPEYECVEDSIIPYMNTKMEADEAAFVYHCGDILGKSILLLHSLEKMTAIFK